MQLSPTLKVRLIAWIYALYVSCGSLLALVLAIFATTVGHEINQVSRMLYDNHSLYHVQIITKPFPQSLTMGVERAKVTSIFFSLLTGCCWLKVLTHMYRYSVDCRLPQ